MKTAKQVREFVTVETLRPWFHVSHIIGPDGSRRGVKERRVVKVGEQIELDKFLAAELVSGLKAREISRRCEDF